MHHGDYKYSRLLGAYVGTDAIAASGVPDRFLDPTKERSTPKAPPQQTEAVLVPKEDQVNPPIQAQSQQPVQPIAEPRLVPISNPVTERRVVPVELVKAEEATMPPPTAHLPTA